MTERLWFKIGEAAQRIGVSPKDLRYWESVIPELRPRRSRGNLRYYHLDELPRLERVREWLAEGLTVADCRQLFTTGSITRSLGLGLEEEPEPIPVPSNPPVFVPPKKRKQPRQANRDLKPAIEALRVLLKRLSKSIE